MLLGFNLKYPSFGRKEKLANNYLLVHMLLCWVSLGDGFILGIFLGLGMVYEFDLLVRGLYIHD